MSQNSSNTGGIADSDLLSMIDCNFPDYTNELTNKHKMLFETWLYQVYQIKLKPPAASQPLETTVTPASSDPVTPASSDPVTPASSQIVATIETPTSSQPVPTQKPSKAKAKKKGKDEGKGMTASVLTKQEVDAIISIINNITGVTNNAQIKYTSQQKYQYIKVNLILNRIFNFQLFIIFFIYLEIKNGSQRE